MTHTACEGLSTRPVGPDDCTRTGEDSDLEGGKFVDLLRGD